MRSTRSSRLLVVPLALLALLAACEPEAPPVAPPPPTGHPVAAVSAWAPPAPVAERAPGFDPVAVGMTPDGIRKVCDEHLARAAALVAFVKGYQGAPPDMLTTAQTLDRWDEIAMEVQDASMFPYLMEQAHPDKAVRDAAKACKPKADAFMTALYLDPGLASVMKAYAAKGDALTGERARLLSDVIRDFHRNGADLSAEKQTQLKALSSELSDLGQQFETNIAESKGGIKVDPKQLEGLPKEWITKHAGTAGGADKKVFVSTDYPDALPFLTYAKDRKAADALYVEFQNRGGDANVALLGKILERRRQKANLLGYPNWAAFAIEPRMAKTPETVRKFLATVSDAVKEPAKLEYAEMLKEHVALGGKPTDTLTTADRTYLTDRVKARKYKLDSKEVSEYFEVSAVIKGLLAVTAKMYALEYRPSQAPVWHPDVQAFEVWSNGQDLGTIYLDLFSRPDKYKHAAEFTIRSARRLADGTYQKPSGALECNFPKPGGGEVALMAHDQVEVFFHEFGHLLHNILTTSELATYSGANTVQDFVEAPSQMFEEWVWSREVLDLFARHYKTGKKLPDALFKAMLRARGQGRALNTQRQLFFATVDLEYHTRDPGFDSTAVWMDVASRVYALAELPGTHPQSSFGHLIGYDAGYYSYQWALSLSRDVLTRFKREGLLNPATAKAWRDDVLAKGGGTDERQLVTTFLGREPNAEAYIEFVKGRD